MPKLHALLGPETGRHPVRTYADLEAAQPANGGVHRIKSGQVVEIVGTVTLPAGVSIVVQSDGALMGRRRELDGIVGAVDGDDLVLSRGGVVADLRVENTSAAANSRSLAWNLTGEGGETLASGLWLVGAKGPRIRGDADGLLYPSLRLDDCLIESPDTMTVAEQLGALSIHRCVLSAGESSNVAVRVFGTATIRTLRMSDCQAPAHTGGGRALHIQAGATVGQVLLTANDFRPQDGSAIQGGSGPINGFATTDANVISKGNVGLADSMAL